SPLTQWARLSLAHAVGSPPRVIPWELQATRNLGATADELAYRIWHRKYKVSSCPSADRETRGSSDRWRTSRTSRQCHPEARRANLPSSSSNSQFSFCF